MFKKYLEKRRERLAKNLKENELLVIFGNGQPTYPRYFLQDRNFFYLSGIDEPNLILTAYKSKKNTHFTIFIERTVPERVVWEGKKISKEEATEISGVKDIKYIDEFDRIVSSYLSVCDTCYVNNSKNALKSPMNISQKFISDGKNNFPEVIFKDAKKIMVKLRAVKDDYEIQCLVKAIQVTGAGIKRILKNARVGMYEYELEAMYLYEVYKSGLKHIGFKSIVAAGKNATTLHYEKNRDKIKNDDLVLLDLGALNNYYSADISRTFPIEKKFSSRQKDVYSGVLFVQKQIINMAKARVKISELQEKTKELLKDVCYDLKLIKNDDELKKYYMHGVSHHLGMDTHDIMPRDTVLETGNIITVEPGLYIPEEGIGVRIEDDILITEKGRKILSDMIPKEIEELEEYRK